MFSEDGLFSLRKCECYLCLQTARPPSPACPSSLTPSLNFNHLPRPRKPRDTKPKMKKLKYHQYIPPDQRGGSGTGGIKHHTIPYLLKNQSSVSSGMYVFVFNQIMYYYSGRSQTKEPYFYPAFRPSLFPSLETAAGYPPASNPPEPAATTVTTTATATAHCCTQVCVHMQC